MPQNVKGYNAVALIQHHVFEKYEQQRRRTQAEYLKYLRFETDLNPGGKSKQGDVVAIFPRMIERGIKHQRNIALC